MSIKLNTPLKIDEIDFRIQSISEKGYATILAYKDARVDMKRLDDVYGVEFWQKKYSVVNGNLFCSIGIYNRELKEWIWKEDVGTESMTEKEKGQASDAFKRAGFNLGIGRELYDYPRIFLQLKPDEFKLKQAGQKKIGVATFNLKLDKWKWDVEFEGDKVKRLTGKDHTGAVRFDSNKDFNSAPSGGQQPKEQQKAAPKQNTATVPANVLSELSNHLAEVTTQDNLSELFKQYKSEVAKYPTLKGMFTNKKVALNGNA